MTGQTVVVVAHALVGIVFVAGLIGRWIVLAAAARADSLPTMRTLAAAAGPFERIVIGGSTATLLLGLAAAWLTGRSVLGPLTGGSVDWLFVSVLLYLSIIPLIPFVFLPRGRVFSAAMAEAEQAGVVTDAVRAAWRDPLVRAGHGYELAAVTLVLVLMLAKPF
jgi:hypothetical protein